MYELTMILSNIIATKTTVLHDEKYAVIFIVHAALISKSSFHRHTFCNVDGRPTQYLLPKGWSYERFITALFVKKVHEFIQFSHLVKQILFKIMEKLVFYTFFFYHLKNWTVFIASNSLTEDCLHHPHLICINTAALFTWSPHITETNISITSVFMWNQLTPGSWPLKSSE